MCRHNLLNIKQKKSLSWSLRNYEKQKLSIYVNKTKQTNNKTPKEIKEVENKQ